MLVTAYAALAAVSVQAAPPAAAVNPPPPVVRVTTAPPAAAPKGAVNAPPAIVSPPAQAKSGSGGKSATTNAANEAAQAAVFAEMAVKALDRILPPQADPEPARLALARTTMDGFMPAGSYSLMVDTLTDNLMNGVYERLMGMTGTELSNAIGLPVAKGPDAALTLRQQASKDDPLFDARIKAYASAFKAEMRQTMVVMEPKMREGMARAMARRFNAAQLTDLNRFFATDTGRAFGRDMMLLWIDGDVYRGMLAAMPDLMRAAPASAKRFEEIEKKYPWPKKAADKKAPADKK